MCTSESGHSTNISVGDKNIEIGRKRKNVSNLYERLLEVMVEQLEAAQH